MNWLVAYRRHSSNYIIGCLDTTIAEVLRQKNMECVLVPNQGGPLMPGLRLRERARRNGGDMRPRASRLGVAHEDGPLFAAGVVQRDDRGH